MQYPLSRNRRVPPLALTLSVPQPNEQKIFSVLLHSNWQMSDLHLNTFVLENVFYQVLKFSILPHR